MKRQTLKTLLAIAALAGLAAAGPVLAQTKLKWAHVYETSEPYHTQSVWARFCGPASRRRPSRVAPNLAGSVCQRSWLRRPNS